ncbi:TM2 domain-containing protein [Macrococcus capreoli]|uniref:TM2 domain-containing protein n=1 Tax=Macrococcus capreoli TaxID=2982690 RepID=UPI0021D5E806|nr:TM2 domain-containing protein [Macrococcus sp. TMW 2.2395]MCU7558445.1 TM2 domain-containing protein [Macrococcus sp. TMW 2.2395]
MNIQERQFIETKVMTQKKSTGVAYLLWFFLGGFGAHRFYFGKTASAIGLILLTFLVSSWTFGIPSLIWLIVDAFLIPNMIKEHEENIRRQAIAEVQLSKAHSSNNLVQEETAPINVEQQTNTNSHEV